MLSACADRGMSAVFYRVTRVVCKNAFRGLVLCQHFSAFSQSMSVWNIATYITRMLVKFLMCGFR
jgi:hypothetical protein